MKDVPGLFVFLVTVLVGSGGGIAPSGGYCIGTQCFSVFHHGGDFAAARIRCRTQDGHLMTVRSSVSHDVLNILLGNSTGRFWIGLHRPGGCPDPAAAAARLRGFQWVTKDGESDLEYWAPDPDGGCDSHRCVSVSQEDEFRWTPEPCAEYLDGFLCEHSFTEPCSGLAPAQGETVTYKTPMGFAGEDLLSLPPGSTAVRMPAETKYVCFSEQWLQAPWSCEIQEGGCEHKCAVDPNHVPACYCPRGQTVNPANKVTCEVDIEDPCRPLGCAHACYEEDGGSYACVCDHGFKLAQDGRSCVDFNDCVDARQCPGDNYACVNNVGGFKCVCKDGYAGSTCVDVNECVTAPCEHECVNTPGSYKCTCYDGYKEDPKEPHRCRRHCGEEECPAECDPNNRYQCFCPDGYVSDERADGTVCVDIDECAFMYCDQGCRNTFGSYVCSCYRGYTLEGEYTCVKNDDDTDSEGSGETTTPSGGATASWPPPPPGPTGRPSSGVSTGVLVGIIVCTAVLLVLVVFLVHHVLNGCGKSGSALKDAEGEAHGLHRVASDA